MHGHTRFLLLAVLFGGTVVIGGTLAVLARSGSLDHRGGLDPMGELANLAALAGFLAAAGWAMAVVGLVWARIRTERSAGARKGVPRSAVQAGPAVAVIPLGEGQAAIVFEEDPARPRIPPDQTRPLYPRREAAVAADAIWDAVTEVAAAASDQMAVRPPVGIPNRHAALPRDARSWARRLRHGLWRHDRGR